MSTHCKACDNLLSEKWEDMELCIECLTASREIWPEDAELRVEQDNKSEDTN